MSEIKVNSTGEVKLFDSDNSNYVSIKSPATVASDVTLTLPSADGSANTILKTDGSGNLAFFSVDDLTEPNIDWQSSIKTSNFTAASGEGYFCDTSGGAFTATLPSSPTAGAIVAFKDYAPSFATHNLTIGRNSSNIQGNAVDSLLSTNRASVVMVYVDSTKGWLFVQESNVGDLQNKQYVTATGGTITTSGDFKIHTFTSSGTFTVSDAGNAAGSNSVAYLVLAGGGGGGNAGSRGAGGGGAGGFREGKPSDDPYTASPLNAPAGLPVSAQGYPITVGAGGAGAPSNAQGGSSVFSTITSAGGGTGGIEATNIGDGGSGGGAGAAVSPGAQSGGSGNTPPVSPPQGNDGGDSTPSPNPGKNAGGGGGGAGAVGNNAPTPGADSGTGGAGATSSITGSPVQRGGGGGGSGQTPPAAGGDGGGAGGSGPTASSSPGNNGTANFGGGGGAGGSGGGGTGGSGVVIIRYKYQN
jgi:hypothetical protein